MLKTINYEASKIEDIILDLADEVKNGWKICSLGPAEISMSLCARTDIVAEVVLRKDDFNV
jgi:hypothetical protein